MFGIDDLALSDIVPGAISALGSFFGQSSANDTNITLAQQNRDWQTQMSNTAHQREVADLQAAGLNPILSASRGGAVVPSSSPAQVSSPLSAATHSAVEGYKTGVEATNRRQERAIKAPLATVAAQADKGIQAVEAATKGIGEGIAQALPLPNEVAAAGAKLGESVSGTVAQAADVVKEAAHQFGVSASEVLATPGKFVSSVVNSAVDYNRMAREKSLSYVPRNKVVAGSFTGDTRKDLKDIADIRDPHERRMARQSYRLWREKSGK